MPRLAETALLPFKTLLGKIPDQQIADKAGVSRALVVNYRKRNGVPPYEGYKFGHENTAGAGPASRSFRGRRSALDPYVHMLGKVADVEIARLAGVTTENVRTYRQRRNIAPDWQASGAEAAPVQTQLAVTTSLSAPAAAGTTAFLVVVDTEQGARNYALVAADIAEAAGSAVSRVALRHPNALIRSIARVAELLP